MVTLKGETRWMAVMKLLSSKSYSMMSLKNTICFAWAPAHEVIFRDVEEKKILSSSQLSGRLAEDHRAWPLDLGIMAC
jgi:hypothetical protein